MNLFLQKIHVQKKIQRSDNINALCWAFYCVNDGKEVEGTSHQLMRCIMCCVDPVNVLNPRVKERKGLITYCKTYGTTILKKHVEHFIITKKFEKEINNEIIESVEK